VRNSCLSRVSHLCFVYICRVLLNYKDWGVCCDLSYLGFLWLYVVFAIGFLCWNDSDPFNYNIYWIWSI
jgi:hypothetical protein